MGMVPREIACGLRVAVLELEYERIPENDSYSCSYWAE